MYMAGTHPTRNKFKPPVAGRIIGVDFREGIELILKPQFQRWCPPSYYRGGSWSAAWDPKLNTINFVNGSTAEFMSYEQDVEKFAGTSRHFIHFDEEPPQDIYIECMARLIDTFGDWWMTLTPVLGMEWMYDEIFMAAKSPDSDIEVIEVDMAENPHLDPRAIQAFLDNIPEDDRDARSKGKFVRRGGVVYNRFDTRIHKIPQLDRIPLPPVAEVFESIDHGFNNPTAWLWHLVFGQDWGRFLRGDVITFAEHYEREMVIEEHASQVLMMRKAIGYDLPSASICDPACSQRNPVTGTSVISEYALHGINLVPGNNEVTTGINKVNAYMTPDLGHHGHPRWYVTENCENLLKELPKYRWKTWANKKSERSNNAYDVPHKKDDHACDSLRYFFTFMPDITPIASVDKIIEPTAEEIYAIAGRHPVYDRKLQQAPTHSEWNVRNPDEYMGGEW